MKFLYKLLLITAICEIILLAHAGATKLVGGTFSEDQIWNEDTIKITDDVLILNDTLTIFPGTYVEFLGHFKIEAQVLIARGTFKDSIVFTVRDTNGFYQSDCINGSWKGILTNSLRLEYCRVEYVKSSESDFRSYAVFASEEHAYITNSVIRNNGTHGIGIIDIMDRVVIKNTLISDNQGNGLTYKWHGNLSMDSCTIRRNRTGINLDGLKLSLRNSIIEDNMEYGLRAIEMINADIAQNVISNNHYGILLDNYNLTRLSGNKIHHNFIGISVSGHDKTVNYITGNEIFQNQLGATFNTLYCKLINNLFYRNGNTSENGGALMIRLADIELINNTIVYNKALNGAAIYYESYNPKPIQITNCILYNNDSNQGNQLFAEGFSKFPADIMYSNVKDLDATSIDGSFISNMDEDPLFTDGSHANFKLGSESPCIDAGNPDTTGMNLPIACLYGNHRIINKRIDMGCHEYSYQILIVKQPLNITKCLGDEIVMESEALGRNIQYQWQKDGKDLPGENAASLSIASSTTEDEGIYTCVILNEADTVYSNTAVLKLNIPRKVFIGNDTSIFVAADYEIIPESSFDSYLWNTGETSHSIVIHKPEAGSFNYWVRVSDEHQCVSYDTITVSIVSTQTPKIQWEFGFNVFPNPASDFINISMLTDGRKSCSVQIWDLSGKVLINEVFEFNNIYDVQSLNIVHLKNGVYILMIDGKAYRFIKNQL